MDAASYLKRQGWRGDGHSLDQTGRGISRPLLVSKKVDVLGVGLNKHAAVSDQWWMRAFDQGLKDLGTGKRTALADVREKGHLYGGLYGRFVKGDGVAGTFETPTPEDSGVEMPDAVVKKRKRDHEAETTATKKSKAAKGASKKANSADDRSAAKPDHSIVKQPSSEGSVSDKKSMREAKAAKKLAKRMQRAEKAKAADTGPPAVVKAGKKVKQLKAAAGATG